MSEPPLQPGDAVSVRLDSLAIGGEAVGRHEGMAVFAMWGCPGDEAEVEITQVARRFARGVVREVVTPSADRVQPPCPHFGDCGGCQLQHISYPAQLRHKTAMVRDALARIGSLESVEVGDMLRASHPWRYRGRVDYRAQLDADGKVRLGFLRHHSHDVVGLLECRIQHPLAERVRRAVERLLPRFAPGLEERRALLNVEVLSSFAGPEGVATLVCLGRPPFVPPLAEALAAEVDGLTGVCAAQRRGHGAVHRSPAEVVVGSKHVEERLGAGSYRVSADSFFQTNPAQAAGVVELVREWAQADETQVVVDAYTGVGTFLLPLAEGASSAVGVEADNSALQDARSNALRWGLGNVTLQRGRVERALPRLAAKGWRPDVVVLDPPRRGCGPIVCAHVAKLTPRRIILVSCHPAMLGRDLKSLAELGYPVRRVQPVDMFPQTWHVEAVALCERAT